MDYISTGNLRDFLERMIDGVAYCQMTFEDDKPIDWRYLYTNPAFHAQTGLGEVAGKLVSEILPDVSRSDPVLLETYGRVSSTGESASFEIQVRALDAWFRVHVFCPKLGFFVSVFNAITKAKYAQQRVEFLATHDLLTELPNRPLFYDRLSNAIGRARRNSGSLFVFLLDLDSFKPINDLYGHHAGDVVLKNVARRLLACVRQSDTVARLGGDEFGLILEEMTNAEDARVLAEKFATELALPITLSETSAAEIGVSIGIASYPDSGEEIDTLMHSADLAMYEAKRKGKGTYAFVLHRASRATVDQPWINLDGTLILNDPVMDRDHREIAKRINRLNLAARQNESAEKFYRLFGEVIDCVIQHFLTEERLMDESHYPDLDAHKTDHAKLLLEVERIRTTLMQGGESVALLALKDWFLLHIVSFDKPLAEFRRRTE